jgi:hypothetical protein
MAGLMLLPLLASPVNAADQTSSRLGVDCLARPEGQITRLPEEVRSSGAYRVKNVPDDHTFDARAWKSTAYGVDTIYPFSIGNSNPRPRRTCVVGGTVVGSQPRSLTWREMKRDYDGAGVRLESDDWMVVDGLRTDNVMDALRPARAGSTLYARNVWASYTRDDCIENDLMAAGVVSDSLFDGCHMGVSERSLNSEPQPAAETFTLDRVLLRLQLMPYDQSSTGRQPAEGSVVNGRAHAQLFKWSGDANKLVLKDSVFLVPRVSTNGKRSMSFPEGTVADNVTLIWLGEGDYPGRLPASGVTVTRDKSIWRDAKADWLDRHGCTSLNHCDPNQLTNPEPATAT